MRVFLAIATVVVLAWIAESTNQEPGAAEWPFEGVLGKYERDSLQRGLNVYLDTCSLCHSLKYIAYRNLTEIGLTEDQAKDVAARSLVTDGPDETGQMFERTAILSDYFVPPYANDAEGRFMNGGALPPDLSLITKAREHGSDYVYELLTGYLPEAPAGVEMAPGMSYNAAFPGGQIAMPQPLFDGMGADPAGNPASLQQASYDIAQFLTWAAEPTLEARKRLGLGVMIFLVLLTGMFIVVKRRVWADVH
jgi:cytochrome c1